MTDNKAKIVIVGGGLAGSEAAWQCVRAGYHVVLKEMRPVRMTEAHKGQGLAELVCSNSFKSFDPFTAAGELKHEMGRFHSIILKAAEHAKVPAGQALAVERNQMSEYIESELNNSGRFVRESKEVIEIPSEEALRERNEYWIIATGPLTSDGLSRSLTKMMGNEDDLYFYDAIAPVVDAESLDLSKGFFADRYKDDGDYYNLPLDEATYHALIGEIAKSEKVPLHAFEEPKYFEACLPIEVMIERGPETLRFGPLKPVGFVCPTTGKMPHAVIQMRAENRDKTIFSLVGFQTKMKWPEQQRIFKSILPGFENAEFVRLGSVHRNTYINGPKVLNENLSLKTNSRLFLAGQITGVEGYTESACIGMIASLNLIAMDQERPSIKPPLTTMMGALLDHVTAPKIGGTFQPMNTNLGILPVMKVKKTSKQLRRRMKIERALKDFEEWFEAAAAATGTDSTKTSSVQPSPN